MRLIDADALYEFIQKWKAWKQDTIRQPRYDKGKYDAYYEMLEIIKNQHTVDAVPVVRCGECKYYRPDLSLNHRGYCRYYPDDFSIGAVHFCSYGKRKGDEDAESNT